LCLGHNGAGKSTSLALFAAELKLQHGDATYHLRQGDTELRDADGANNLIRTKIGVCPQHNTALQDELTCRETLRLFAYLKGGISIGAGQSVDEAVEAEVERRLQDVQFTSDENADTPVGTFSGGMKRKVLIAMALLGDPEVVFLDGKLCGALILFLATGSSANRHVSYLQSQPLVSTHTIVAQSGI
jgi:ABC-2 type transport system ATP-binding protein